jgi:hypothetical protein
MSASVWQAGTAVDANHTISYESFTATPSQTLFTFSSIEYVVNSGALWVFVSGVHQRPGVDFTETSATSFTLSTPVAEGTIVHANVFTEIANVDGAVQSALDAAAEAAASATSAAIYQAAASSGEATIVLEETSTTASNNYNIVFKRSGNQSAGSTATVGNIGFNSKRTSVAYDSAAIISNSYTFNPDVAAVGTLGFYTYDSTGATENSIVMGSGTTSTTLGTLSVTAKTILSLTGPTTKMYAGDFVSRQVVNWDTLGAGYLKFYNDDTQTAGTSDTIGSLEFRSNRNGTDYKAAAIDSIVVTDNPATGGYGTLAFTTYASGTHSGGCELKLGVSGNGGEIELVAYKDVSFTITTGKFFVQNYGVGAVIDAGFDGTIKLSVPSTASALSSNKTMTFELTSDTQLTIKVRGSDGTTRSVTLTLS